MDALPEFALVRATTLDDVIRARALSLIHI